jgi:hypothetical protein
MRTLLIATALLSAFAAHAEPKRVSQGPLKPIVLEKPAKKEAAVDPQAYQPKVIEAKPIELATPELEIKTKDLSDSSLDKKLAKRLSKSTAGDASVLREPAQIKFDEPAPTPAPTAATSATTANKP